MRRVLLMIGIALLSSSGCVSDDSFVGDGAVTYTVHDGEDATLDHSLKAMMRARSRMTTHDDSADHGLLDNAAGEPDERCGSDEQGHTVCCDDSSACCVHSEPSGDVRVCL